MSINRLLIYYLHLSYHMMHSALLFSVRRDGGIIDVDGRRVVPSGRAAVRMLLARGSYSINLVGRLTMLTLWSNTPAFALASVKRRNCGPCVEGLLFRICGNFNYGRIGAGNRTARGIASTLFMILASNFV